jgi:hypothetical protein
MGQTCQKLALLPQGYRGWSLKAFITIVPDVSQIARGKRHGVSDNKKRKCFTEHIKNLNPLLVGPSI